MGSNSTFSLKQDENFDGSSKISLYLNDFKKVTIKGTEGPFRVFTVMPEEGYLVDQLKLEGNSHNVEK